MNLEKEAGAMWWMRKRGLWQMRRDKHLPAVLQNSRQDPGRKFRVEREQGVGGVSGEGADTSDLGFSSEFRGLH